MKGVWHLLLPGIGIKRWLLLSFLGVLLVSVGFAIGIGAGILTIVERTVLEATLLATGGQLSPSLRGLLVGGIGAGLIFYSLHRLTGAITLALAPQKSKQLINALYRRRHLEKGPRIVALGGGTGLAVLLRGLKEFTGNITAIVTMADNGGSSGRLREEMGILPPGDIRNCLLALADTEPLMEKLFQYRFGEGTGLAGHSFGNLFIAAMSEINGDFELGVREASKVLAVRGQVLPSTGSVVQLQAEYADGSTMVGESEIPRQGKPIRRVNLLPDACRPPEEALVALREAELIILGPGSLYTSVLPNLLVREIASAIQESPAAKVYVCNIMTQPGETDGYTVAQHVQAILEHAGPGVIDYVLINRQSIPARVQRKYAEQRAFPVQLDRLRLKQFPVRVLEDDLVSNTDFARHDSRKLAKTIYRLAGAGRGWLGPWRRRGN